MLGMNNVIGMTRGVVKSGVDSWDWDVRPMEGEAILAAGHCKGRRNKEREYTTRQEKLRGWVSYCTCGLCGVSTWSWLKRHSLVIETSLDNCSSFVLKLIFQEVDEVILEYIDY